MRKMREEIARQIGPIIHASSLYSTEPWGFEAAVPFLNQVVAVQTSLSPLQLLACAQGIEKGLGRERPAGRGYSSRTADIDILTYGELSLESERLTLPHPRIAERRFILAPLAEMFPKGEHPTLRKSWGQLLEACEDQGEVKRYESPNQPREGKRTVIVADGGATTVKWAIIAGDAVRRATTRGLNPLFVNSRMVLDTAHELIPTESARAAVAKVSFYGASCGPEQQGHILQQGLSRAFPNAEIVVDSDMMAAAIACWGKEAGNVAILGTGSNAGFYDGRTMQYLTPSLGFILGDEGSGAWFGKRVLRDWLYGALPSAMEGAMRELLREKLRVTSDAPMRGMQTIVEAIHHGAHPSATCADFARLLAEHRGLDYVELLLEEGFTEFVTFFLKPLEPLGGSRVRCVGSVAHFYRDALEAVCQKHGLELERAARDPLENLANFNL